MSEDKILDAFRGLIKGIAQETFIGKVIGVNEKSMVAEVAYDELIYDVQLRAVADQEQRLFVQIPALQSYVVAAPVGHDKERCVLLIASVVEKVIYQGENTSFIIDDKEGKIIFNNADKGSYLTDINKLVEKINAFENDLNALKNVFKSWVPAAMDGGAALKVLSKVWEEQPFNPLTTVDDLKDEMVEH
ncbi:hypothetical protein [Persicobacter sp. CCB-QB2]|uniref:hypothetical protein n=1 Tax=Persicobacter sp. CCB-QB2 TaxID=1561025 RepID=UPI0006A99F47|nr:hypothetical protein [Persicobacter sp. CCB-QB2]